MRPVPRWPLLLRSHVTKITVIPLEAPVKQEDGRIVDLRRFLKAYEVSKVEEVLQSLPEAQRLRSRTGFLKALRSLHWLHTKGVPVEQLKDLWHLLEELPKEQIQLFLPLELAEILELLASCQRPSSELVRHLSRHVRQLSRAFSARDIGTLLRAYSKAQFASSRTVRLLGTRLAKLLRSEPVQGKEIVVLCAAYPRLNMSWRQGPEREKELQMWKALIAALPERLGELTGREHALLLNGLARLDFGSSLLAPHVVRLFAAAGQHLVPRVSREVLATRDLALIANGYAKVRASGAAPLMKALSSVVLSRLEECNVQDLVQLLNASAMLSTKDFVLFEAAATEVMKKIMDFEPLHLALTAHAYGKQQQRHEALFEVISERSLRYLDQFGPQELSNLAYGLSRLQVRHKLIGRMVDEVIFRGTIGKALPRVNSFSLRDLEALTEAFSRLFLQDQKLYFVLFDLTRQRVREFTRRHRDRDQDGSSVHGYIDRSRLALMASKGEEIETMSGSGLAAMLAAFAKSQSNFHSLIRWVPHQVAALQGQYSTHQLAVIFNACSRLGIRNSGMYAELLSCAKPRIPQMSAQDLVKLMWSMSKAKLSSRVVLRKAVKIISVHIVDLNLVELCASLVACSEMNYRDERFLRLLATVVQRRMGEMASSQLATAFACLAQMRIHDPSWFDAVLFELFQRQSDLREKDATNVAYGMVLLGAVQRHEAPEAASYPFSSHQGVLHSMLAISNSQRHELSYPAIYQLQILELYLRLFEPESYAEMRPEIKVLMAKARKVSVVVEDYMQNSSRLHRRISQWFTRVGLEHRSEVFLGPFMLDMLIGERVVVEVDGPSHFYRDTDTRTARSILKSRMLEAMGFHVRHLPYQEWQQCGSAVKRTMYCSEFWKDVVGQSSRRPELVDILDVVVTWQSGQGPHPSRALLSSEPAFYADALESDAFDAQELLEEHAEAEDAMVEHRKLQLSSKESVRRLLPRSRRREVRHTGGGVDYEALEADTESEDEDERLSV